MLASTGISVLASPLSLSCPKRQTPLQSHSHSTGWVCVLGGSTITWAGERPRIPWWGSRGMEPSSSAREKIMTPTPSPSGTHVSLITYRHISLITVLTWCQIREVQVHLEKKTSSTTVFMIHTLIMAADFRQKLQLYAYCYVIFSAHGLWWTLRDVHFSGKSTNSLWCERGTSL